VSPITDAGTPMVVFGISLPNRHGPGVLFEALMPNSIKRGGRRARRGPPKRQTPQHTSHPTSRLAYAETRRWLLAQHGPVCAYCGLRHPEDTITLDHVTPRKGQTAYDRRDNLVLACKRCNGAKADKPFLAYLLGQRMRAANLLKYGQHLSAGILELVRHIAGGDLPIPAAAPVTAKAPRVVYGSGDDSESPYLDSPYLDSPYRLSA
jgi:hypothetical protein